MMPPLPQSAPPPVALDAQGTYRVLQSVAILLIALPPEQFEWVLEEMLRLSDVAKRVFGKLQPQ